MPLFEVAVLETELKGKDPLPERLALGPVTVLAKDSQSAALAAVMDNGDKMKLVDRARMQVIVRPFA